jgi:hypothetical protein
MVTYITLKLTAADAKERKRERDRAHGLNKRMQLIRAAVKNIIREKTSMFLELQIVMHES